MTKWKKIKLGNIISIKHGYAFKGDDISTTDNGVVLVTPGNFAIGGGFQNQKCKYFTGLYPEEYSLQANDLIVTMTDLSKESDTLGYGALVPNDDKIYLHNQRIGLVEIKKTNIDKMYLYWFLRTRKYQKSIVGTSSGSVIKHTSPGRICDVELSLPPLEVQKKIAAVLNALDDKIELNNRINNNLEQQAQALFKSWFVDFEPFGGTMPNDWKVGKVDDIIELFDFQRIPLSSNQRENMNKIYPYYGATSLMDYVDNYIFDGKYLLLGEDGTVIDGLGFPILQYVWGKFWVNNHAHILQGKNGFNVESLYLFFRKTNVKSIVTGAVQPKINQVNLKSIPAIIPCSAIMNDFNAIIEPLFSFFRKNIEENNHLAQLRDALLPKLISGEINVSKVDISTEICTDKLSFNEALVMIVHTSRDKVQKISYFIYDLYFLYCLQILIPFSAILVDFHKFFIRGIEVSDVKH